MNVWPLGNITICDNHYLWPLGGMAKPLCPPAPFSTHLHGQLSHAATLMYTEMYSATNANGNDEWDHLID